MIRAFRADDLPAAARIWRELRPDAMHSERGLRHLIDSFPPRAEPAFWVAEADGVVAWCFAHRRWHRATDNGYIWAGVLPAARGRGLGTALWKAAERHLAAAGVARINADVVGDDTGARFLERHGFAPVRTVIVSAVDPRRISERDLAAWRAAVERGGYRLAPYAEVDPRALYELDLALSADEPGESEPRRLSFEEWRSDLLEGPDLTQQGSFAMVANDKPVTYSALSIDPATARGRNEGTATAARHRGRGLATLAKLAQLRWAAENGIERVVTDNDEGNVPMLAINSRLGYRPFTERRGYVRAGTAGDEGPAGPAT